MEIYPEKYDQLELTSNETISIELQRCSILV